jgi:hypothetical protein
MHRESMKFCPICGAAIDSGLTTCPSCGADVSRPLPEPPVEKLVLESCGVTLGATLLRVKNAGTAPLAVEKVIFGDVPIRILGISSGTASLKQDRVIIEPGDSVTISLEQSPKVVTGNEYKVVATTATGRQYYTTLVW